MEQYKSKFNLKYVCLLSVVIGASFGYLMPSRTSDNGIAGSLVAGIITMFFPVSLIYFLIMVDCNKKIKTRNDILLKNKNIQDEYDKALNLLNNIIVKHFRALKTKEHQLVSTDSYGNVNYEEFEKEIEYFYENVFLLRIYEEKIDISKTPIGFERFSFLFYDIYDSLEDEDLTNDHNLQEDDLISPIEFEFQCADRLSSNGWQARTTKGSGDQGVDVIAEKNDIKAVFQCKYYSTPVGNKAVQEIVAGRQHELADIAAVITNSRYTKSAEQLARSCDVLLLHFDEIDHFDDILMERV